MKGEEGELVVLEGEEEDGDEVLEAPSPPKPLVHRSPSCCKKTWGRTRRSPAREPLPPGLP